MVLIVTTELEGHKCCRHFEQSHSKVIQMDMVEQKERAAS